MTNKRKGRNDSEEVLLMSQVDGTCPLCNTSLYYKKNSRTHKGYEVAHIYPLNPTSDELVVLANVPLLSSDPNDLNNLIPLCFDCHPKFDKPRTEEEYLALYEIKKKLIDKVSQREIANLYHIEDDICTILDSLHDDEVQEIDDINFDPKNINEKFDDSIETVTRQKIRFNVSTYFPYVQKQLSVLEQQNPHSSELLASQIRTFYIKQKTENYSQQKIFENISDWIFSKGKAKTQESAEIIASYYVQNCEIYE